VTSDGARLYAAAIGRILLFVLLVALCAIAADALLSPVLVWLVARTGQRVRIDMFVELAAALAATAIMVRAIDKRRWADVGLARRDASARALFAGWSIGMAAIALTSGVLALTGLLRFVPATGDGWIGAALRITAVLVPSALAEELLCRGYLLTVVRERIGVRLAVLLTSVMFGLLHLANPGATAESVALVTLAGIFLAAVRVMLDSLYAAWMAHLAWNWVMAVLLHAAVSGVRFESPEYQAVTGSPAWVSGGAWGPEGGVMAGLGMMTGLAYLYTRRRREES
jgi:membrane protease YdiL (CAAX protease family)